MNATESKDNFDNKRKLHLVSNFEYLMRQLDDHGVDTDSLNSNL
jgi:hypothetical protein